MIRLTQLPRQAKYWTVQNFINWALENKHDGIINDRIPVKPYQEYTLAELVDNSYLWDNLQRIM